MTETYFPPAESNGGWRTTQTEEEMLQLGGMDPGALDAIDQHLQRAHEDDSWNIAVIRHGYLVREHLTFNVARTTRFDIWSGTKSFTGTAWGILLDDLQSRPRGEVSTIDLNSRAYDYIPAGQPLSDPRKRDITIQHLLSMTSGIAGESTGLFGISVGSGSGAYEFALGHDANRFERTVADLAADPGSRWDYSDAAFAHLTLAFQNIAGQEIADFMAERVFEPIGIENLSWDIQGGAGFLGPHTNPHSGIHVSARELARFGYLTLHGGSWDGSQLIPAEWVRIATASSQTLNPDYGYTWWTNAARTRWPKLPSDTFALSGYRSNRCFVIPSLDMVIARVGSGPLEWGDDIFLEAFVGAIVDA